MGFTCEAGSAPVTVTAADGGVAVVTSPAVSIDLTAPTVRVAVPRAGRTYDGEAPAVRCVGDDALSGVASCDLEEEAAGASGERRVVATATDLAGHTTTATTTYTVRTRWVPRSTFVDGAWNMGRLQGKRRALHVVTTGPAPRLLHRGRKVSAPRLVRQVDGGRQWSFDLALPRKLATGRTVTYRLHTTDGVEPVRLRRTR